MSNQKCSFIPPYLEEDYNESNNTAASLKSRATAIRRCAEGYVKAFLWDEILAFAPKASKGLLFRWISELKKMGYTGLALELEEMRVVGNPGAHFGPNPSEEDLTKAIEVLPRILSELFYIHFSKAKGEVELLGADLVLFSTLPPELRVIVWEKYTRQYANDLFALEKYLLALVKSGRKIDADKIIDQKVETGVVDARIEAHYREKIDLINRELHRLPIAEDMVTARANFETVMRECGNVGSERFSELAERLCKEVLN
ncbi:hypothetical protein [Pseudodesulfovibrio sp.]|uniref:hypothetical protein n=1 Tax=unclassified Pseudodesulfovibrio TaxID=2661612 RepID=UPI003AFFE87B